MKYNLNFDDFIVTLTLEPDDDVEISLVDKVACAFVSGMRNLVKKYDEKDYTKNQLGVVKIQTLNVGCCSQHKPRKIMP